MHLRYFYNSISYYDTLPDITTTILSTGYRDRDLMVIAFSSFYAISAYYPDSMVIVFTSFLSNQCLLPRK